MILSGHAPMQIPQRRQRVGLGSGLNLSSSLMAPNGHSTVQRLHCVHLDIAKSGNDRSPTRGCTADPIALSSVHWMAFMAAPVASSMLEAASIGILTLPAA